MQEHESEKPLPFESAGANKSTEIDDCENLLKGYHY